MQIVTYAQNSLVKQHRGTMPILLTCPHGGSEAPPGVAARSKSQTPGDCGFETNQDLETSTITEAVAQRILELTGLSPYVVIAGFHRRFIDANRPIRCAYTDPDAEPFYAEYHAGI